MIELVMVIALLVAAVRITNDLRQIEQIEPQAHHGRYFVIGGPLWSKDAIYGMLTAYGMKGRPEREYRHALEWVRGTLVLEGGQATNAVIEWQWTNGSGIVYADRPGIASYQWAQLLRNITERAAMTGRQGGFR